MYTQEISLGLYTAQLTTILLTPHIYTERSTIMIKQRWYIQMIDDNDQVWYYAGADQWIPDHSKRYLWYSHKPINHPVFAIYSNCAIITEGY